MEPDRPLIQIDNLVRPMTDDEYAAYQEQPKDSLPLTEQPPQ